MHKKLLISFVLILSLIIPFGICYANDEMQKASDSAKNAISGAENAIEGAAKNTGNAIKDGMNQAGNMIKDSASKAGNSIQNGVDNLENSMSNTSTNYDATRTSAEGTFMGMTSTTWSWLILGIAAIAIIGLVWYYSVQLNNGKNNHYDE